MTLYDELIARGLIAQVTNEEEIKNMINNGKATFYIGFDCTADSLSMVKQVICITHLPQIAAMADHHFYIEKNATDHSTATTITELSEADSLKELARLSGAAQLTESVLANAKEMKDLAEKKKQN